MQYVIDGKEQNLLLGGNSRTGEMEYYPNREEIGLPEESLRNMAGLCKKKSRPT